MNQEVRFGAVLTFLLGLASTPVVAQHPPMPPGMTHQEHQAEMRRAADMKKQGADAMGFDQDRVEHHFLLIPDGGIIQVDVRHASDETNREAIRMHLRHIAAAFADGDFAAPFVTHAEVPPGVPALQRLKATITYTFNETPTGGFVRIATTHPEALAAVHQFLRYQIRAHHTGDSLEGRSPKKLR